jgi:hypothetical protein
VELLARKNSRIRLVLTMEQIMQSIAIEVDGTELETVNSKPFNGSGASSS